MPFSDLHPYDRDTVRSIAPHSAGVYRLSQRGSDSKFYVFYVGQGEDLADRLMDHLQDSEPNPCITSSVSGGDCAFRYITVPRKADRDTLESQQISEFGPRCNRRS